MIVGLSSFGHALYEEKENSGIGSNGFTVARHVLLSKEYAKSFPETFSSTIPPEKVYGGPFEMSARLPDSIISVGDALLSPTRTYVPIVRDVLNKHRDSVSGIIHCTGGGQTKCKNFGENLHFVKINLFTPPPVFRAIQEIGGLEWSQMFQIFNMGHRLEMTCVPSVADSVIAISEQYGVCAKVVGEVLEGEKSSVKSSVTIRYSGREHHFI